MYPLYPAHQLYGSTIPTISTHNYLLSWYRQTSNVAHVLSLRFIITINTITIHKLRVIIQYNFFIALITVVFRSNLSVLLDRIYRPSIGTQENEEECLDERPVSLFFSNVSYESYVMLRSTILLLLSWCCACFA